MARGDERGGISRRTLLIGGGAGVGLLVAYALWPRSYEPNLRAGEGEQLFNAFLKIGRDGRVIVAVPQAEAGQGVYTALPQILADELGADWRTVSVEPAPLSPLYANLFLAEEAAGQSAFPAALGVDRWAARRYALGSNVMLTGGSSSVRGFEARLREAGAGARALLCQAAAARWNVGWEELDTRQGFVVHGNQRLAFAELAEEAAALELPATLPMRGGNENRLVGQPLPRLDVPAKIDGSAMFAGDVRLRDMCFVALRTTPPGGRLLEMNWDGADSVPGAFRLIQNPGFVAVAGVTGFAALKALDRLSPTYEVPSERPSTRSINAVLTAALDGGGEATRLVTTGDPDADPAGSSRIEGRYAIGPGPSAPIEPLTATARMADGRLEIWAPTLAPAFARAAAARAIDISEERVTIYPTLVGGGYGRKLETEAIAQAAIVAQALGQPAQLVWPRIQEIQADTLAPPARGLISATLAGGRIHSWRARIASPDAAAATADRLRAAHSFFRPDGGVAAGAVPPYDLGHVAVDHVPAEIGIPVGIGRGGAHVASCFFTESFIDEVARLAGQEPLSYRMAMLSNNPRLARCLASATSIGGWDGGVAGGGMGIACHAAYGSCIAALVEVAAEAGRLRALRAVIAVDCGRIVNPELVKQQVEGGFIHGLLYALGNPVEIEGGVPSFRYLGDYGLPTLANAPEVSVELMESEDAPGGVTDLAVPVAAPAVANAFFALSGRRARTLPIGQRR